MYMYTPANEPKVVTLDDAAVAKLRPAVGDLSVPGPDLVWLEDVHESTMLHNLRLRYAQDKIYSESAALRCLLPNLTFGAFTTPESKKRHTCGVNRLRGALTIAALSRSCAHVSCRAERLLCVRHLDGRRLAGHELVWRS